MDFVSNEKIEKIEKIIIENINIMNAESSINSQKININLQINVVYKDDNCNAVNYESPKILCNYIKKWLYDVKSNELKPSSFDRTEQIVSYQIIPYLGDISINKISSDDIQQMINQLKNKYSYSTIKRHMKL